MCNCSTGLIMEGERLQEKKIRALMESSNLLELAAADDVLGFVTEVEQKGIGLDEVGFWYGRRNSSKSKMGFEERTPLMIASLYGSIRVLKYIIGSDGIDVNKTSGTDGATALHCSAAGGSVTSVEAVKLLLNVHADVTVTDANGNKPGDVIARGVKSSMRKALEMMLKGFVVDDIEVVTPKKEYPVDVSLPDINTGVYGSDEFRMFTFKVKPCSRAYTHDWTECPFVHPGENARRRDPRKFNYTCVPCPEFRKGSCVNGDSCEYAHGVFESWLHPAQYRTRLCKDETGCARKVCFFAHKVDELRPLYASTGSAISCSTPPASPSVAPAVKSPVSYLTPPSLQLSGSRLKTALNARDMELIGLESVRTQQQRQRLIDDVYGSFDQSVLSPASQLQSPTGYEQIRHQLRGNYSSSPMRNPASFGFDSSSAVAQAVMNSRSGAFSKQRSQSFIDRGVAGAGAGAGSGANLSQFSQWGSPDGKVDWGFNGEEANKLRKSASFGFRNGGSVNVSSEPDVSWVGVGLYTSPEKKRYAGAGAGGEKLPQWVEQMYIEQEQLVA